MHPKYIASRFLIALIAVSLIALLAWMSLRGQSNTSLPPSTPTTVPVIDFVTNIPQKAAWKNNVMVSAEATPGTTCQLIYISPSGENRQTDTIANINGLCEWKWQIKESEGKGHGRLIFTIGETTETHFLEILPSF